jgi:hypothetical protein
MGRRLLLYAFRYKSPVTGKWVKARYVAELHEIRERHGDEFELIGEPEVREVRDAWMSFNPYRKSGEL